MKVRVEGRLNLLSGHYSDIIIEENRSNNFIVKARPDEKYIVQQLDDSYSHFDYSNLKDLEKIRKIIQFYLNNNTIFMLTSYGRLKNYSGHFQAINVYYDSLDGYQKKLVDTKALYFRICNKKLEDIMYKIIDKYEEDRIRHLYKIVDKKEIIINIDFNATSYYIDDDRAYITLKVKRLDDNIFVYENEKVFLNKLLTQFIKKYGYHQCLDIDINIMKLYAKNPKRTIIFNDELFSYVLSADREVFKMNRDYDNIAIGDYLSEFKENPNQPKIKIKN